MKVLNLFHSTLKAISSTAMFLLCPLAKVLVFLIFNVLFEP